ncbi:MAG: DUF348 domain-containing protein [Paenibacillaceae bacterium]|nr:DUF348 domain-containing protein [Paenibacillaceae bacterium]
MTFAWRWKHENARTISIIAGISCGVIALFFMLLYGTATKSVSVVLNGQETVVQTKQWVLGRLLDEQAISVGEHDRISMDVTAKIKSGDRVNIVQTTPILVTADGKTETLYTSGKTVESALQDLNISLGPEDKIEPSLDGALTAMSAVKIVRVTKDQEEESVPIAFDTVTKNDASLLKGKEQTVQEGKEGKKIVTKENVYEDGKLVAQNVVGEKTAAESVDKIVAIGTKNPVVVLSASSPNIDTVTKSGQSFAYKSILNNVTLTAYSNDVASTGKSSGHPGYGLTYSGTTTTEGVTIAVDKNVIPLGWWVYIEGIGFRRAEDIGSGVKGNMIDIYYNSMDYASKFGMKRGYTVYVIGPKKPTAD